MKEMKLTIFHKMIGIIFLLLIPIVLLYTFSNTVSVNVVQEETRESLHKSLAFLMNRIDLDIAHEMKSAFSLSRDPELSNLRYINGSADYFDVIDFKKQLYTRIGIQSSLTEFPLQISVFFPYDGQVVSTDPAVKFDAAYLSGNVSNAWQSRAATENGKSRFDFFYYVANPFYTYENSLKADHVVEVKYPDRILIAMMDEYRKTSVSDPFLYHPENGTITNSSPNGRLIGLLTGQLAGRTMTEADTFQTVLDGQSYLVNYNKSANLGWYLVDYVPVQQTLLPITESRRLFYGATLTLLVMSCIAALILYRNVQIPLRELVRSLLKVKRGDLGARIAVKGGGEFDFVHRRFNEMAEQIEQLVRNVYAEKLTSRDAQLKQLQSQINPHFLYNCLFYIVNMSRMDNQPAVEEMALNLGDYFKYTTRLENPDATVAEELEMVSKYLEIQNMRMERITFELGLPDELLDLEVPRLLLQPIVENAIVHGIEPRAGEGFIRISGSRDGLACRITVADNGVGLEPRKLDELNRQLRLPMHRSMGYGVWNVNQRLTLRFGESAGVHYAAAPEGGLIVTLSWSIGGGDGDDDGDGVGGVGGDGGTAAEKL